MSGCVEYHVDPTAKPKGIGDTVTTSVSQVRLSATAPCAPCWPPHPHTMPTPQRFSTASPFPQTVYLAKNGDRIIAD